jgi:hypothetical protein
MRMLPNWPFLNQAPRKRGVPRRLGVALWPFGRRARRPAAPGTGVEGQMPPAGAPGSGRGCPPAHRRPRQASRPAPGTARWSWSSRLVRQPSPAPARSPEGGSTAHGRASGRGDAARRQSQQSHPTCQLRASRRVRRVTSGHHGARGPGTGPRLRPPPTLAGVTVRTRGEQDTDSHVGVGHGRSSLSPGSSRYADWRSVPITSP